MTERLDSRQFLIVASGVVVALAPHLARLPAWLSMALGILLILRVVGRQRQVGAITAWLRLPLAALLIGVVMLQYSTVFGREPGSAFACGLLVLKLLETELDRDARVVLGFAAFVLMSALLFTQTLLFTIAVCLALIVVLAGLVVLEPSPATHQPLRNGLRIAATLLGMGLPLAIAAFLLLPRLSSPLWGAPGQDVDPRTGLSERMAPGTMTELLIDDSPALRAMFDDQPPAPAQRYFRALVMSDFDGVAWNSHRRGPGGETLSDPSGTVTYTITLEPTGRPWLPALDMPLRPPPGTRLDSDRVLTAYARIDQPRQYTVTSATGYRFQSTLPADEQARNLALPGDFNPRSRALAQDWRNSGRDDAAIIRAALDLFHASFSYTLTPPLLGRDSVDDFLFETRSGYCEHFSSAFTVLMRAAGIPARVVTGYQGGWWNANNDYLLVRQSDAHAWSEVWLLDRGWVRVDPTAAVSPERVQLGAAAANGPDNWYRTGWLRDVRNRLDSVNRAWTVAVVQFNALRQKSVLTPFGIAQAGQRELLIALLSALGALLIVGTLWAIHGGRAAPPDRLDQAWARLNRRLARIGIEQRPNEGPLDLLRRARPVLANPERFEALLRRYVALRYGCSEPAPEQVRAFARAARDFRP